MIPLASLLFAPSEQAEARKILRLLEFFGVSSTRAELADFLAIPSLGDAPPINLVCSTSALLTLIEALERTADGTRFWRTNIHSVLVCAADDVGSIQRLAARLTGDDQAAIVQVPPDVTWFVTDELRDFCKSMSGLQVHARADEPGVVVAPGRLPPGATRVVSCEAGAALLKFEYRGVPVYLSTAKGVIDLDAVLTSPTFDVRRSFLLAVPLVMYVRWAFGAACWSAPLTGACLVIDDPLLKPRYGFLKFTNLLELTRAHKFSTSVAFIPWNWRRSAAAVVRLFRANPTRLSLSIHGCDHTGGEFGIQDSERLAWRATQALTRMSRHESLTRIPFDRVMVFPQGVFSCKAMEVLKRSGFIGSVNTEITSSDPQPPSIRVSDYWNVAVMNYCNFPLFTRRYPSQGVVNFAFDILLGKPCLIVVHHDDCREHGRPLAEFIDALNSLNAQLSWCSLGEVVQRSCRQRENSSGLVALEMYGSELCVDNASDLRKRFRIHRRETDARHRQGDSCRDNADRVAGGRRSADFRDRAWPRRTQDREYRLLEAASSRLSGREPSLQNESDGTALSFGAARQLCQPPTIFDQASCALALQ